MSASQPNVSGSRRALSDFADLIINDTEDGVNVVIENRDKVPYILNFNFSQTENMTLEVSPLGGALLTDTMKVLMEVPSGATRFLGDFHVIDEDVTSLCLSYRVRCNIRNPITAKVEPCPTARNQERTDVPETRVALGPTVDLVARQAPSGFVCYLESKGPSDNNETPLAVTVDFSKCTNAEIKPLDTRVQLNNNDNDLPAASPLVATLVVPSRGTVEFVEVGPKGRGPFTFSCVPVSVVPVGERAKENVPKTTAVTLSTEAPSAGSHEGATAEGAANAKPNTTDDGSNENEWDAFEGGSGGNAFDQHDGGCGGFGSGSGAAQQAPADAVGDEPDVSAHMAGGPPAGQHAFINDGWLLENFPKVTNDFGKKGAKDGSPHCRNWTAYRWVLKRWEDERVARITIEAEWKVRMSMFIKEWHESVCNVCRRLLLSSGTATEMVQYKEFRLHKICYERAEKCDICGDILVGEYVVAKGLEGTGSTKLHVGPCVDAYRKRSRPPCYICKQQIIEDKWGTCNGQPFHFGCKK